MPSLQHVKEPCECRKRPVKETCKRDPFAALLDAFAAAASSHSQVSFAEYSLFYRALLRDIVKRGIFNSHIRCSTLDAFAAAESSHSQKSGL